MKALHHSRDEIYRAPLCALELGSEIKLAIDIWDAPDVAVMLRTWTDAEGETRLPMQLVEQDDRCRRFSLQFKPKNEGIVWYQFVISDQNGREWRYGARENALGGEGALYDWEPPSFKLTVFNKEQLADGSLEKQAHEEFAQALIGFLRGALTAPVFAERLHEISESCEQAAFQRALDILATPDQAHLMAQLAEAAGPQDERRETLEEYGLDEGRAGLAKGRLWCASLTQAFLTQGGFASDGTAEDASGSIARQWGHVDADCETIVQNALDLRRSFDPIGRTTPSWFALNDDVLGILHEGEADEAACLLVNASLHHAHDVRTPVKTDAVSEVIAGYAVPIVDDEGPAQQESEPGFGRAANVRLNQLGTAVLHCHAKHRLAKPIEPGVGVLAHITSLPSGKGKPGCIGAEARKFIDRLADAGIAYWQILPVNPTDEFGSPYAGISAFAGNALLLEGDVDAIASTPPDDDGAYAEFCSRESRWLEPYASFMAIRQTMGSSIAWQDWPKEYRRFDPKLIESDDALKSHAEAWRRIQFAFEKQWKSLRAYANERGVKVIGDMPIYVSADSADVWANPGIFQLGDDGKPCSVAGCPPDSFAEDGQVWGNPLYDWDALKQRNYDWWLARLKRSFELYDIVRLDHFIGFARYFAIPSGQKATAGAYRQGPGIDLFNEAFKEFGPLPVVAEDLGLITPAVRALCSACGFPGMDVIQFADGNDPLAGYTPRPNKIVYTGTHDNQTLVGYCASRYPHLDSRQTADELMRKALQSNAELCIVALQDVLGLDDEARMNVPGTAEGNWTWQTTSNALDQACERLRTIADARR